MLQSGNDERRQFARYNDHSECEVRIDDTFFKGVVVDYSDGLGVIIEKARGINKGDFAEIRIPNSSTQIRAQVAWIREMGDDARVGFKRVGNLRGNLKDFNLPDLLIGLQRGTKTGTLEVVSRSIAKRVFISNGDMIFSASSSEDDRLGEMLLREGRITVDQFNKASERLLQTGEKLGKILVDMGCIIPKELFLAARRQVEEIILSLFTLEEGTFEFTEGPLTSRNLIALRISAANIIYRGMKKIQSFTRVQHMCPSPDSFLILSQDPINIFQSISLEPEDKQILYLIQGNYPLKTILQISPMSNFETLKIISAFLKIGIITVKNEEHGPGIVDVCDVLIYQENENQDEFLAEIEEYYAKCESADYYEFLGINRTATVEEIQKTYYSISKRFHPDRHFSVPKHDIKGKLIKIFSYASEANSILSDPDKKKKYDEKLGISTVSTGADASGGGSESVMEGIICDLQESAGQAVGEDAATHFELGEAYLEMGLEDDAIKEFRVASRNPEYKIRCCKAIAGCFIEQGQLSNAIEEMNNTLSDLAMGSEEYMELKYDLAEAYANNSEYESAHKLYGEIYSLDASYRDVARKIESMGGAQSLGKV